MGDCKPFLTRRFDAALQFASALHHSQCRKGTKIPYISHLMVVSALVLEAGGDEDQAISALLHDAVEDQGGAATLNTIRRMFGDRVANAISECSDTDIEPKPPWRKRKEACIAHLKTASHDALIISVADKLHNARAIVADYKAVGEDLWKRFNAAKEDEVWYYEELSRVFQERTKGALVDEFSGVVKELKQLTNSHKSEL